MSFGGGRVTYLAVGLGADAFRGAASAPLLWARILPQQGTSNGGFVDPGMDAESIMTQALAAIPSLEVPPAELLLALLAAYILLIGPISYIVLRRIDRRELAWVTAPVLVAPRHASVRESGFDPATLLGDHRCALLLPVGGIAVDGVILDLDDVHDV